MPITHLYVNPTVDEHNPGEVGPDEWNDVHTLPDFSELGGISGDFAANYLYLPGRGGQTVDDEVTINDGLLNGGDFRTVGYGRFGSLTAPANTTDGDLTAVRFFLGDTAVSNNARFQSIIASHVPATTTTYYHYFDLTVAPNNTSSSERDLINLVYHVQPTVNDGGLHILQRLQITHDSGAFNLSHSTNSLVASTAVIDQSVASSTVSYMAGYRSNVRVLNGTATTVSNFQASASGGGVSSVTTWNMFLADTPASFPTLVTTYRGVRIENMGNSAVTTAVGLDVAAQSGATNNFGIRNAGNMVQTGYMGLGAITAPANTTNGDLTLTRMSLGGSTLASGRVFHMNTTQTAASGSAESALLFTTFTPSGAASTSARLMNITAVLTGSNNWATGFLRVVDGTFTHRSSGTLATAIAFNFVPLIYDSSSGATPGTITTLKGVSVQEFFNGNVGSSSGAVTTYIAFHVQPTTTAGLTTTTKQGLFYEDDTASTITTQIGVDIAFLSRATTNIGIRNASTTVLTPSTAQNITAAGTTLLANASIIRLTANNSYTLSSTPTIADGQNGQELIILNVDSADTITLQDQGTLANSNLRLAATTVAIAPRCSIRLVYSSDVGDWVQVGAQTVI